MWIQVSETQKEKATLISGRGLYLCRQRTALPRTFACSTIGCMLPVLEGVIARRVLLNFRADPEVAQRLLPIPLEVEQQHGSAILGVCLIRLEQLRPRGIPGALGVRSENMAHRVAIRYPTPAGIKPGVLIWRRETDQKLVQLLGGRLFPGVHHAARFRVIDDRDHLEMEVTTPGKEADVKFSAQRAREWTATKAFSSFQEASEFFRKGDCGFSCSLHGNRLEGLQLKTLRWEMQPLAVESQHCRFYADTARFPAGSIAFDSALLMRGLPHEWHEITDIPELAAKLTAN